MSSYTRLRNLSAQVWGDNVNGQLGDGTLTDHLLPTLVPGLSTMQAVGAGFNHSLAIGNDGSAHAWGDNFYGQIGNGTTTDVIAPVQLFPANTFAQGAPIPTIPGEPTDTEVLYYHSDAIGSIRMITNAAGTSVARYDYLPSGQEWDTQSQVPWNRIRFTGQERDTETSIGDTWLPLDYFGARYYQSQTERFTSPDPITVNALRIANPQRWNRYSYAVNNPLKYTDPAGLDALLINYADGAHGFGHVGIMTLNPDGSGLYGGFSPVNVGRFTDAGTVKNMAFRPGSIAFGPGGRPTIASLNRLREQLARLDGKSPQAIRMRHIKTSDAETAALAAYIGQNIGSPARYNAITNNCLDFCVRGLERAGIPVPPSSAVVGGMIPDLYFRSFLLDLATRLSEQTLRPRVETSYCIQGMDCK